MGAVLAALSVLVPVLGALEWVRRQVVKPLQESLDRQRLRDEDWNGVDARPGVDRRVGVMERLKTIEAEVTTNGGSSMRDSVRRIEKKVDAHLSESRQQRIELDLWRDKTDNELFEAKVERAVNAKLPDPPEK